MMNFSEIPKCREISPCVSDLLKEDETLDDEAITDCFLGARKELGNIELFF